MTQLVIRARNLAFETFFERLLFLTSKIRITAAVVYFCSFANNVSFCSLKYVEI